MKLFALVLSAVAAKFCRQCNDESTYLGCVNAAVKECVAFDNVPQVCFFELRQTGGVIDSINSGCQARDACLNDQHQNFVKDGSEKDDTLPWDQCMPDGKQQAIGRFAHMTNQSVCRQCYTASDTSTSTMIVSGGGLSLTGGSTEAETIQDGFSVFGGGLRSFWKSSLLA
jgi:ribosomal protein L40E